MLRLFFHRKSFFVKAAFYGAWGLTLAFIYFHRLTQLPFSLKGGFYLSLGQILFAKFVEAYPWYPATAPGPGIRLQFQKALVPVAYLWFFEMISLWLYPSLGFLIFFNLLFLPMGAVAIILIYFHCKDPDPTQPNLLSGP